MLTVREILHCTGGSLIKKGPESFIGVSTDSRTIKAGEIFIALKGEHYDGHSFYKEAMKKGGGALINHDALYAGDALPIADQDLSGTLITVDDTLKALHRIAYYLRHTFSGRVFAIVGSNGKTTTKELLYSILSRQYKVLKTPNNNNNHIGMPRAMTFISPETECLVLELGTNRPGDIKALCEIARPHTAVITNIGLEHLEGLGGLEGVRDEELQIIHYVDTVVANADDGFLMEGIAKSRPSMLITYGINTKNSSVMAKDIVHSLDGVGFRLHYGLYTGYVQTSLYGNMNVYNCLAAAAAALTVNMSLTDVCMAIRSFKGMKMRLEVFKIGDITVLNDCYNANPSSMQEAINELKSLSMVNGKCKRTVAVLGDMFEIGDSGEELHRDIGKLLNNAGIEVFIGTGPLMKRALEVFRGKGLWADNPEVAGRELLGVMKPGDIVLIKGSRGMKMERVTEVIKDAL